MFSRLFTSMLIHMNCLKMLIRSQIHLPSFLSRKKLLHKDMTEELRDLNDPILSFSRFCRLWKNEFGFVVIPPVRLCFYSYHSYYFYDVIRHFFKPNLW